MELHSNDSLPSSLYTAAQTRELDRLAISEAGLAGGELMVRAGEAAWSLLRLCWPRARRVGVLCGPGNNGGDGYIVARLALQAGYQVELVEMMVPAGRRGDAGLAVEQFLAAGGRGQGWTGSLPTVDVWVDGLLGTGLARDLTGDMAALVDAVNASPCPVLALDIPSGLHADTGAVLKTAIRATHTVSFIGLNIGLFTASGPECTGRVHYARLGVPDRVYKAVSPGVTRLNKQALASLLPPVSQASHKGTFGRVLVVGGAPGMAGAAVLAGLAAYRAGAGLVTLVTHVAHAATLDAVWPSLMVRPASDPGEVRRLAAAADVVLLGPGLGRTDWGRSMAAASLDAAPRLVIDADGLAWLGRSAVSQPAVVTPHPGEAGALLGLDAGEIQAHRPDTARRLAERYGAVTVLKGAGTLVCDSQGSMSLSTFGGPALATGGTGDVLAGLIAGIMAQGLTPFAAARLGVGLHGLAADVIASGQGVRGMLAEDLLPVLPRVRQALAQRYGMDAWA